MVLISKGNAENRGIGLIEVLWKVVKDIIYTHTKTVVTFHDILNGLHASRGTGIAIMELNMAQEIASINQYPLFLVFLDLWKVYNTLDRGKLLHTLEGYGAVQNIKGHLEGLWEKHEVVTR